MDYNEVLHSSKVYMSNSHYGKQNHVFHKRGSNIYLCPIMNRMTIPFSCSSCRSLSPDKKAHNLLSVGYLRRTLYRKRKKMAENLTTKLMIWIFYFSYFSSNSMNILSFLQLHLDLSFISCPSFC